MKKFHLRNIAIISHVDHGKTTLLNAMLKQTGVFHANRVVEDRVMDSMDLERERGITIMAKNTAVNYNDVKINIVDTPGHADFGGEVERSLNMVDGAILLVDASEGPLPQTRFVLKKALGLRLPIILVINKIDRSDARIEEVISETYDLFIDLGAEEHQIEFPILYTNAKAGISHEKIGDDSADLQPLLQTIIEYIPPPQGDDEAITQFLVTNLDYDPYVGQIAVGRLQSGKLEMNTNYSLCTEYKIIPGVKLTALYTFFGLAKKPAQSVESGDIIALSGVENVKIGDTISSLAEPRPLPRLLVDEPTVSMMFYVNDSPFGGKEGKYLTSRHLLERLEKEQLRNVAIKIKKLERTDAFEVCGRGELQMAVLIETMRREGYELTVGQPQVIVKEINGKKCEPYENLVVDVPQEFASKVIDLVSRRKGEMLVMETKGEMQHLEFEIPSRGVIGLRTQMLTATTGEAVMAHRFTEYKPWKAPIPGRSNGVLLSKNAEKTTGYSIDKLQDRGTFFVDPAEEVYAGQIIAENIKPGDLVVNATEPKKLTNHRASGSDDATRIAPKTLMSLEECMEYIQQDECIEVTPNFIRMRKVILNEDERKKVQKKMETAAA